MAEVILSINGVDQPTVLSRIDGLYLMDVEGIQPGDVLRLRAQAPQDDFEPLYYEWQAEEGLTAGNTIFIPTGTRSPTQHPRPEPHMGHGVGSVW